MYDYIMSNRRNKVLVAVMALMGAIIVGKLFYLQVIMHGFYESEANKEHTSKFLIPAKRGEIYARDGLNGQVAPLVLNVPAYTAYADPRYVKDVDAVIAALKKIAGGNLVANYEVGLRDNTRQYQVLAKQLNSSQADLIKAANLDGVGLQQYSKRVYPEASLAAQVLGFMNDDGEGQYGIEQGMDSELSGVSGQLKAITDVHGIPLSIGQGNVQTPAKDGKNLVLSIDRNIQLYTEQALKAGLDRVHATKGSVLVMNPNNGQIMAMANYPTFDPNNYQKVTDYNSFQNAIISQPYEPGSVIKTLTMSAGLDAGTVKSDTKYNNTGSIKVADATIRNADPRESLGPTSMTQVLRYSLNTGAVYVLQSMGGGEINSQGKQKLFDYFTQKFFLAKLTGIKLAGEQKGKVFSPSDSEGGDVRYANMSFGQGMNLTMIQVASAFCGVINGGNYYTPQVVYGSRNDDDTVAQAAPAIRAVGIVSAQASSDLRNMLHQARLTGPFAKQDKPGYYIGGKTGTAQVYDPKTGTYSTTDTIGSFLGFGGQSKPEYVIMVRVDDAHIGDYAGSVAAEPIFSDISNWLLGYLNIQPQG